MALRLSELDGERVSSPGAMGTGAGGTGAGMQIGSFQNDKTPFVFQSSLAEEYQGPSALSEMEFPAIPGLKGLIGRAVQGTAAIQDAVLRIEVWQDTAPIFDKYRVRIWTAGEVAQNENGTATASEILSSGGLSGGVSGAGVGVGFLPLAIIPLAVLFKIVAVVGVAAIIGVLIWKVSKTEWGGPLVKLAFNPLVIGLVAGAAVLLFVQSKTRQFRGSG